MKRVVIVSENYEGTFFECVLDVPEDMDLEAQKSAWRKWYKEEYCITYDRPGILRATRIQVQFRSLLDQLLANGCRKVDVEMFSI